MTPAKESRPLRVSRNHESAVAALSALRGRWARLSRKHLSLVALLVASALSAGHFTPASVQAHPISILLVEPLGQEAPGEGEIGDAASWVDTSTEEASAGNNPEAALPEQEYLDQTDGTGERITGTSRGGSRPAAASTPEPTAGERVATVAKKYVGYPYAWAGSSPQTGFDCSGFDTYVYEEAGIPIPPHDLWGQMNTGPRIARQDLQPGDLVFFQNTYKAGLSHGGVYVGNGQFIHSIEPGVGVQFSSLDEAYWSARFLAASRPWAGAP